MENPKLFGDHPIFAQAQTEWVSPEPGIRLRFAKWVGGSKGTIHIFNGRTEYIEKYADLISEFCAQGYSVTAHDWRGQGLSTRNKRHPARCHIDDFDEFQRDADAIIKASNDLPSPRLLFCHSMGGAIGMHFLMRTNVISSVVFAAPMWGIYVPKPLRLFAPLVLWGVKRWNAQWKCVVGTREAAYETYTKFRRNLLTNDKAEYQNLQKNLTLFPELAVGGPTYYWYFAALREMEMIRTAKIPDIPALVFVGTNEKVVEPHAIQNLATNNQNIRLVTIKNAKHEIYVETPKIRKQMWSHLESFWFTS